MLAGPLFFFCTSLGLGWAIVTPVVIDRANHNISRANISSNALKVLRRLHKSGFAAHLVGGGVRDLLLGREPKDFDIATDASPEQVREQFRNCRLIGRRFRLAHVHFGREIIEVATFRGGQDQIESDQRRVENGMLVRDNVFGAIEDDAIRRDFTVNALYYNIADFSVIDYANGMADLEAGVLRLMGDPEVRYREDPVRMLRAVRFASKLGFVIAAETEAPLFEHGVLLEAVPAARLFDEIIKLMLTGFGVTSFEKLRHYGLFEHLFPDTEYSLSAEEEGFPLTFVERGLENSDKRVQEGKPVTPAFLFAVLLWEPVRQGVARCVERGEAPLDAMQRVSTEVITRQLQRITIPKRFGIPMREIWSMQQRLQDRRVKSVSRLLVHPRFRAAYDFLWLRGQVGQVEQSLVDWWTEIQTLDAAAQAKMISSLKTGGKRRRRRRKPRANPGQGDGS